MAARIQPLPAKPTSVRSGEIAVIGMSCRLPGARSINEFWQVLCDGKSVLRSAPASRLGDKGFGAKWGTTLGGFLDDIEHFDGGFFRISPAEANVLDPQQAIALEEAWHALEDAGIPGRSLQGTRTGIFLGIWAEDFTARMVRFHFPLSHSLLNTHAPARKRG